MKKAEVKYVLMLLAVVDQVHIQICTFARFLTFRLINLQGNVAGNTVADTIECFLEEVGHVDPIRIEENIRVFKSKTFVDVFCYLVDAGQRYLVIGQGIDGLLKGSIGTLHHVHVQGVVHLVLN